MSAPRSCPHHVDDARVRLLPTRCRPLAQANHPGTSAFTAGGIAACGAVTVTHSFETVKIRLQLQGELQAKGEAPRLYKGVFHGIGVILKNEGPRGLLRGLSCAVRLLACVSWLIEERGGDRERGCKDLR